MRTVADIELPDDLVELQRAADRAESAYTSYVQRVSAERRALFADPVERAIWPEEQAAEMARLRAAFSAAQAAVDAHPALVGARGAGTRHQTVLALRAAAAAAEAAADAEAGAGVAEPAPAEI